MINIGSYVSPLGKMTMACRAGKLIGLWFDGQNLDRDTILDRPYQVQQCETMDLTRKWLDLYFDGQEPDFLPPIEMEGTPFRRQIMEILLSIPYGQSMSYGQIAALIAQQRGVVRMAAQAVGSAVGHNPISLIVPCHRVIGTNGKLVGYGGGLWRKEWLLQHEGIAYQK